MWCHPGGDEPVSWGVDPRYTVISEVGMIPIPTGGGIYGKFPKIWENSPQIIHFYRDFHYKPPILGYP